jgi:hypothetical protein
MLRCGLPAACHARPGNDRPSASAGAHRCRWRLLLTWLLGRSCATGALYARNRPVGTDLWSRSPCSAPILAAVQTAPRPPVCWVGLEVTSPRPADLAEIGLRDDRHRLPATVTAVIPRTCTKVVLLANPTRMRTVLGPSFLPHEPAPIAIEEHINAGPVEAMPTMAPVPTAVPCEHRRGLNSTPHLDRGGTRITRFLLCYFGCWLATSLPLPAGVQRLTRFAANVAASSPLFLPMSAEALLASTLAADAQRASR